MHSMLDGLGKGQALNRVTIEPVGDGPLVAVNFTEGQTVHKGDVLARIEPRAFQAALDLAAAKKAQDEALRQVHEKIVNDALFLFVTHDVAPRAMSPKVTGFVQAQNWFQDFSPITMK